MANTKKAKNKVNVDALLLAAREGFKAASIGVADVFARPQVKWLELVGARMTLNGAEIVKTFEGTDNESAYVLIQLNTVDGDQQTTVSPTAETVRLVAYFEQEGAAPIADVTFQRSGNKVFIKQLDPLVETVQ